ncbi:MAG: tetratricopeptide repeat protein [Gammaproteobacteria bacterium]
MIERLEQMLRDGQDSAMLRFSLGNAYLAEEPGHAAEHLARAVELDPAYSAAWKLLGRALADSGRDDEAMDAYRRGIEVAEGRGDMQAAKEMRIFLKRLEKAADKPLS